MRLVVPPRAVRALYVLLLAGASVTCSDAGPTGPGRLAPTRVQLAFEATLGTGAPDVPIAPYRKARMELFLLPGETRVQQAEIIFADGDTTSSYSLEVTVTSPNQRFLLGLTLLDDQDRVVYSARDTVTAFIPGSGPPPPPRVITLVYTGADTAARTLVVAPRDTMVVEGATLRYGAVARRADGSAVAGVVVRFSGQGTGIAVDADGTVRATAAVARGGAFVIARMATGLADSTLVTVTARPASIVLTPDSVLLVSGRTAQLSGAVLDVRGAPVAGQPIVFSSGDTTVATVTAAGLVTARAPGVASVTARAGALAATARIVVVPVPVARIVISPDTALRLLEGGTAALTAQALDESGTSLPGAITWSSSDTVVAGVTTDAEGRGIVAARRAGAATITASSGGQSASVAARVVAPVIPIVPVARVVLRPDTAITLAVNGRTILVGEPQDAAGAPLARAVAWSSADTGVATVTPDSLGRGVVTGRRAGSTTVTAHAEGRQASVTVRVLPPLTSTVRIAPRGATILAGDTMRFSATVLDTLGRPSAEAPSWSIPAPTTIAAVAAATGLVTATSAGAVTLVASVNGAADSVVVLVRAAASIEITPALASVPGAGARARFVATVRDSGGAAIADVPLRWTVVDAAIASIDSVAPQALVLLGQRLGSTGVAAAGGRLRTTATLRVGDPLAPTSVSVTPTSATLASIGEVLPITATVRNADGATLVHTPAWASRDPLVATVSTDGSVIARGNGATWIVASAGSGSDSARIVVRQVVDTILVIPDTLRLALADTATLVALPVDRNRNRVTDAVPAFASSDAAAVSVSESGQVQLLRSSGATVLVSAGGRTTTAVVMQGQGTGGVTARLAYIRITPGSGALVLGSAVPLSAELVDAAGVATAIAPVWASSLPGRVAVSATGVVTVLDTATVTITATSQGIAGHAHFTVLPAPTLTSFSFAPTLLTGVSTSTVRFSVSAGAMDPGLGISALTVEFTGPGGVTRGCTASLPIVGTTRRGTWDCTISIPAGSPAGSWQATRVTMTGSIDRSAGPSQLATFGPTTLTVAP